MALTSVGYAGPIEPAEWADLTAGLGTNYGVIDAGHWKVTTVAGQDRTVSIAAGRGFGKGVLDVTDAAETVQLSTVASGSRWDTIVARRTWATPLTAFVGLQGTSTQAISSSRLVGAGATDDQPIALVQITAGQQLPSAVVDLRCWRGNGGVFAASTDALGYLNAPGSHVRVGSDTWYSQVDSGGSVSWVLESGNSIGLFGVDTAVANGPAPASAQFLVQGGSLVKSTGSDGLARLTFPTAFPNGLLTVLLFNGDSSQGTLTMQPAGGTWGNGRRWDVVYRVTSTSGAVLANKLHRMNWLAVGW